MRHETHAKGVTLGRYALKLWKFSEVCNKCKLFLWDFLLGALIASVSRETAAIQACTCFSSLKIPLFERYDLASSLNSIID